jgi:hypothetical protein
MTELILDETRSHWTSGPFGKKSDDSFDFDIPTGTQFASCEVTQIGSSAIGGGARIDEQPDAGQTGSGRIVVHWWYDAFSKIRYEVKAYAEDIPTTAPPQPPTTIVDSDRKSHGPSGVLGHRGNDTVFVQLPDGYSYERARLMIVRQRSSNAHITYEPAQGSSGMLMFQVHWWYDIGGVIEYKLEVYCQGQVEYKLDVNDISLTPSPAVAGQELDVSADVTNSGSYPIDGFMIKVTAYAEHIDGVSDWVLGMLSSDQRTQTFDIGPINTPVKPGETASILESIQIPATVTNGISPAGTYSLTIVVTNLENVQLFSESISDFKITNPPE